MKKKVFILSTLICSVSLTVGTFLLVNSGVLERSSATEKGSTLNCDYYFDSLNGYESLNILNTTRLNGGSDLTNVKTWGTVTSTFYNANETVAQQFIQSTDKYGDVGATCLYNIPNNQVFPVGSVVTVTGTMTLYNGMSEMTGCTITKDYDSNPSPVETCEIDSTPFTVSNTSNEFKEYRYWGTRKVHLTNVSLSNITSSRQCDATFSDNRKALLFYNSISNQNAINSKVAQVINDGSKVDVTGYLTCYSSKNTGNASLQVLIRDPNDIVVRDKSVDSITVSTNKSFYYKQSVSVSDFTVTANFDNGTSSIVTDAIITNSVDTSTLGNKTVNFSYTFNDKTVYASYSINVQDCIASLRVDSPVQNYAIGESFIQPKVYGQYYNSETDVSDDVTFLGFDSSLDNNNTVYATYTNAADNTVQSSYEVYVSEITSLYCDNAKVDYQYGEPFVTPSATYADYQKYNQTGIDVSDRVTFSGYDPYTTGYQDITVTYCNFQITYEVCVTRDVEVTSIEVSSPVTEYHMGDSLIKPIVTAHFDDSSSENVTTMATFTGFDNTKFGKQTITVSYLGESTSYEILMLPNSSYNQETISSGSISGIGTYDTGNYGASNGFEYYRAVRSNGNLLKLIPLVPVSGTPVSTLPGCVYNTTAYGDIDYMSITYKTSSSYGSDSPTISYGENNYNGGSIYLPYCTSYNTEYIDLSQYDLNYFMVDCGDCDMIINSITIYYSNSSTPHGSTYQTVGANTGEYRIAPTTFSGSYESGVSYVDFPTAINTSTGEVLSTKRYTYYSYDNVSENPSCKDDAKMVNPIDVCNYFLAFGCAPANYGGSVGSLKDGESVPSKSQVNSLFGSDARCISKYSRTDGYATAVPYYGSTPTYYELDIDTNGLYTTSSRQVGRIVAWSTGFDKYDYGYGSQAVCVYTDDHYATFSEYNNYGGFMPRFNAERMIAGRSWSEPITL